MEFGVELDLVDGGSSFDGSDGFSEVGDIPDVELFVSSSSGKIFGVGGNGNGVNGSFMGFEGGSNLEIGVPDLESSVPTGGGEVWVEHGLGLGLQQGGVSNAGNPFSVVVNFTGEFAVGKSVPKFDSFVSSGGDDLSVIGGETTGEDFFGVSVELFGGDSTSEVPESEGSVP